MCRSEGTVCGGCEQKGLNRRKGKEKQTCPWTCCCSWTKALRLGLCGTREPAGDPSTRPAPPPTTPPAMRAAGCCRKPSPAVFVRQQAITQNKTHLHPHSHWGPMQCCQFGQMRKSSHCGKKLQYLHRGAHYLFCHVHQRWLTTYCFFGTFSSRDRRVLLQ